MGSPDLWDEPVLPFSVLRHIVQDLNLTGQDSYCLCLDHVLAFGREWGTLSDSPGSLQAMVAGSVPTEKWMETRIPCEGCPHVDLLIWAFTREAQVGSHGDKFYAALVIRIETENIRNRNREVLKR